MPQQRGIEIELKYELGAAADGDRYLAAESLGPFGPGGAVRSTQVEDRYVDSADWALARAGFAARLRRTSKGTRISLKSRNVSADALHRREELEGPADLSQAPVEWPASPARSVVLELCGDAPLVELLTIRQLRRVRPLVAGETRAELSVDAVEVIGDGRIVGRFDELEVELRGGDEAPLRDLAATLGGDGGLLPAPASKLDRGIAALRSALPAMRDELQLRWSSAPPELLEPPARAASPEPETAARQPAEAGKAARRHARRQERRARATEEPAAGASGGETAGGEKPKSGGPRSIGVLADDALSEAGRKVLRYHFAKMLSKEAGTRSGEDLEDLHQMRVATRRMRAAWRVFDSAFRPGRTKKIRRRLRVLAGRLGTVRDLDVLIDGLEAYGRGLDEEQRPGLEPLLRLWREQREDARQLLAEQLDSGDYAGFCADMEAFLAETGSTSAALTSPTAPHRIRDRAPSQLWAAYEAVRAYEPVLPWADVETLHELRIAGKWLRYTIEFFGEALGPDTGLLVARVTALQDYLGELHDADVAAKLARDVLLAHNGGLSRLETETIGAYLHSRERELARRRRGVGPVWRGVTGSPFRRALGRATARL